MFKRATKKNARLRLALYGPAGSGKTYTSLNMATELGGPIAAVDTERGSMSLYSDEFTFDTFEPETYDPQFAIDAINAAVAGGYNVIVIDSLSHFWQGIGGELEKVDKAAKRLQGNSWAAWKEVTPIHNRLVDTMTSAPIHVIVTMRSKTEWVTEKNPKTGKSEPRRVGLAPIMRDQIEFEFGICAEMNQENEMVVIKTRCKALTGGVYTKPGKEVADLIKEWLTHEEDRPKAPSAERVAMIDRIKDKDSMLEVFGELGERFVSALGEDAGYAAYKAILAKHNVTTCTDFKSTKPAKECAGEMRDELHRLANAQLISENLGVSLSDVPMEVA